MASKLIPDTLALEPVVDKNPLTRDTDLEWHLGNYHGHSVDDQDPEGRPLHP